MRRTLFLTALVILAFAFAQTGPVEGYALEGPKWPNGYIIMNLQLSSTTYPYPLQQQGGFFPTQGLQDFSASWNDVALDALGDWNQYLSNVQFTSNTNVVNPVNGDGINTVFFSSSAFGQGFGADALAVTMAFYHPANNTFAEADVVVNTAYLWDSFRGRLQFNYNYGETIYDIRRVLDHEFGHVLGLNHPDLATPPQTVVAIMNSAVSDLDHIEVDDINGAMSLYGVKVVLEPVNVVANPSGGGTVTGSGNFQLGSTQTITATPAPGYGFVQWDDGSTNPTRFIVVPLQGGTYTATFAQALDVWTLSTSAANGAANNFESVLFAGGTFMAFGNGMATSTDGITWTSHTPTTGNYNPNAVAYHAGTYVSAGSQISSSTDGVNWTTEVTGISNTSFNAVTYGNGVFVAVGSNSFSGLPVPIMTSPDGVNWSAQTQTAGNIGLSSVIFANGLFVAVGSGDSGGLAMTSPDGTAWTTTNVTSIQFFTSIAYGNGFFLASVGYGGVATSFDGTTWTIGPFFGPGPMPVVYGNGTFLAWYNNDLWSSTDGSAWTERDLSNSYSSFGYAYGKGIFVRTNASGISYSGQLSPILQPVLPTINSGLSARGTASVPFAYQMAAANSPLAYNAIGLPPGLTIDAQTGAITGTPTSTGTFPVKLFATNDAGSGIATLTLTIATLPPQENFAAWENNMSFSGAGTSPTDTPQNDAVPNFLKYFYDINPKGAMSPVDRTRLPAEGLSADGTHLTLTYRENQSALTEVTVTAETSSDLQTWTPLPSSAITATGQYDLVTGDPIMQAQVLVTGAQQFLRLNVTSN